MTICHPASNVAKMKSHIPLTDEDRKPWLAAVKAWIDARIAAGEPGMITCSALKHSYRDLLVAGRPTVRILYLRADLPVPWKSTCGTEPATSCHQTCWKAN